MFQLDVIDVDEVFAQSFGLCRKTDTCDGAHFDTRP